MFTMPSGTKARSIFVICLALTVLIVSAVPGSTFYIVIFLWPVSIFALLLISLVSVYKIIPSLYGKYVRGIKPEAILLAVSLTSLALITLAPKEAMAGIRYLSSYAQIAIVYPKLQRELAGIPSTPYPRVRLLETDGFSDAGIGIVYDESREIELLPGTQSQAWFTQVRDDRFRGKCWSSKHLIGNYYHWSAVMC